MGFGLLLIGYVVTYLFRIGMGNYGFAATLVGGFLIILALSKLKEYNKYFGIAMFLAIPLVAFSAAESVISANSIILDITGAGLPLPEVPIAVMSGIRYGCELLQTVSMLAGISAIANEVGLPEYSSKARWDIALIVFEYVYSAVFLILQATVAEINTDFLYKLWLLIYIASAVFTVYILIRCYMYICDENDKDMAAKPSRFAFINKLRAKRQAQMDRAKADAEEFMQNRANKKNRKKKK